MPASRISTLVAMLGALHASLAAQAPSSIEVPAPGAGQRFPDRLLSSYCVETFTDHQMVFKTPAAVPTTVRSIALRRMDSPGISPITYPPFQVTVSIGMGHSPRSPARYGFKLSSNRGADFTPVATRRTIQFPSTSVDGALYRIPLDTPFTFQSGAIGLIEMRLHQTSLCLEDPANLSLYWERYTDGQVPAAPMEFGAPCGSQPLLGPPFGENAASTTGLSVGNPGTGIMNPQFVGSAGTFSKLYGGLRNDQWGGLPLPFDLAPFGAPGCSLYISFDWEWPYMWSPPTAPGIGFAWANLDLPNFPSLAGQRIYVQGIRFFAGINPLDIATSNGVAIDIGAHRDPEASELLGPFGPVRTGGGGQRLVGTSPVFILSDS